MKKTEAVLVLYDKLRNEGSLSKEGFMAELGINTLKFFRYVSELRCYLAECRPYEEIVYRKKENLYSIVAISVGTD
jgi:hypothetical protein